MLINNFNDIIKRILDGIGLINELKFIIKLNNKLKIMIQNHLLNY